MTSPNLSRLGVACAAVIFCISSIHAAEVPELLLGKKGKSLLEETFSGDTVPKGFAVNTGKLRVAEGSLRASQLAKDNHIGAFRYRLPVQDVVVQLDFRFDGARTWNVGFDPAPGELKKKGHLFSVILTANSWQITEHNDKANPESKSKVLATAKTTFEKGQWYTLVLENKGEQVVVQVAGKEPLKASAPDFKVKKPGLVFRMGGKDDEEVALDNVKVWELK
jgi:hypothetical protein